MTLRMAGLDGPSKAFSSRMGVCITAGSPSRAVPGPHQRATSAAGATRCGVDTRRVTQHTAVPAPCGAGLRGARRCWPCALSIAASESVSVSVSVSVSDARPAGAIIALAERLLPLRPVEPVHFLWPDNLWWMLVPPLLPALYLWPLRRRDKPALRLSSLSIVRAAMPPPRWQRHLPPALVFLALALLLLAFARPTAPVTLPWASSTIMLASDSSRSMRVDDVMPSRRVAAQNAAKTFLNEAPQRIEVGWVTFAGTAQVAQRATLDRPSLVGAIDAVQMQLGTAIGTAIVLCLAELFPDQGIDLSEMTHGPRSLDEKAGKTQPPAKQITPVAPGTYVSAAIILRSDGRRTTGVDTLEAARLAADRGVRIHVVGLDSPDGHAAKGGEMAIYLKLDEPTLRQVAQMTDGEYHRGDHRGTAQCLPGPGFAPADAQARHRTDGTAGAGGGDHARGGGQGCRCCGSGAFAERGFSAAPTVTWQARLCDHSEARADLPGPALAQSVAAVHRPRHQALRIWPFRPALLRR